MNVVAVLSMIHESADRNSATRQFRKESVLRWTLSRVRQVENLAGICVICWDDQVDSVTPAAAAVDAEILCKSPRMMPATVEAVSAARRWADGWRGGPLQTCDCDEGIHAPYVLEILERFHADAALLVNPGAAMVDPRILRDVVARGNDRAAIDLAFTAAAPGLGGVLMRETLLRRLAGTQIHAGRLMHYLPDQPTRDPLAGEGCVDVPTRVARTLRRFMLDSDRQINSISLATVPLNGQLVRSSAAEIVDRLESNRLLDAMPREVRIDLTTRRAARPIYLRAFESPAPGESTGERPSLNPSELRSIFDQLARADDLRLTFAGTGDPLLHPQFIQTLHAAREAGINAISVETDLLDVSPDCLVQLVDATPDIISIHLPAFTRETYATVMGRDGWAVALENLKLLIENRQSRKRGVPILIPIFTKCRVNLGEMEAWYDQWLRVLGTAVIQGPTTLGGLIDDAGVADMSPPMRVACRRLQSRMTILPDGRVPACEEDVLGRQIVGDARIEPISDIWQRGFGPLRSAHACGQLGDLPVCTQCKEWHRP